METINSIKLAKFRHQLWVEGYRDISVSHFCGLTAFIIDDRVMTSDVINRLKNIASFGVILIEHEGSSRIALSVTDEELE